MNISAGHFPLEGKLITVLLSEASDVARKIADGLGISATEAARKVQKRGKLYELRGKLTSLSGSLATSYDVWMAHERALRKHNPQFAPHGFFRNLAPGSAQHAMEFLEKFGPLRLSFEQRRSHSARIEVDLEEFWRLHLRFCLVAQLYENRHDRARLVQAWTDVYNRGEEASKSEKFSLGTLPPVPDDPSGRPYKVPFPWKRNKTSFKDWVESSDLAKLKEEALSLVHAELNLHAYDRGLGWERGWEPTFEKFRPVIFVDSLWSMIWELFGLDTAQLSWRRCPHCQRIFYPRRRDQFYCKPRQQALASKREYARWYRAQQKLGKKSQKR